MTIGRIPMTSPSSPAVATREIVAKRHRKLDVTVEHDQCELMIVACMEKKWSYSFN